jgi:hypothetical protein
MIKLIRHIFIVLLLLIGSKSFGQLRPVIRRPPGVQQRINREAAVQRVERVKEKYISQRLTLSSDEAVRFWPIYRQYQAEILEIRKRKRANNSAAQPDGAAQIQNELNYEADLVNIRKKYTNQFLKFLPAPKVSELFKAEREFNDELIRTLKERSEPNTTANGPQS